MAVNLTLVYSGGSGNMVPANSLGGNPSAAGVPNASINNLFGDITPDISAVGLTDYRCLYLFNDSTTTIYNINLWISNLTAGGSQIQLGIAKIDEVQRLTIPNTVTGGSLTLQYETFNFVTNYNHDLAVWAQSLQDAINALVDGSGNPVLGLITVTAMNSNGNLLFDFHFTNEEGGRSHPLISIVNNQLQPSGTSAVISLIQSGSPINTIAPLIDVATTVPGGVVFSVPTSTSPIILPKLKPNEGFPFWIQRNTPSGTSGIGLDDLQITVRNQSLNPYR